MGLVALLISVALPGPRAASQDGPFPPIFEPASVVVPEVERARAVLLLSARRPEQLAVLTVVFRPRKTSPIELDPPLNVEKAEPLAPFMTDGIKDSTPLPTQWHENVDEQYAFSRVLYQASRISAEAFRRGAREDLTYAHLMEQPSRYRGQVVRVQGTLRQLRRYDPPLTAKEAGVANLYEGWIFGSHYGTQPWCVVFTDLPPGLKVGDGLNVTVSADGYFFKRYRYRSRGSSKGKPLPEAPLLIGRTLTLPKALAEAEEADNDWRSALLPVFLVLLGASLAVAIGLGLWYRRGDKRVHARLEAAARRPFVLPETEQDARLEQRQPEN
jgi:hypothetical protein